MNKVFAIVIDNIVKNIIVAESEEIASSSYQHCVAVDITDLNHKPSIGYSYLGSEFIMPSSGEPAPEGV